MRSHSSANSDISGHKPCGDRTVFSAMVIQRLPSTLVTP
jgi:hypothetical protein